jgi:O-antigen ligase
MLTAFPTGSFPWMTGAVAVALGAAAFAIGRGAPERAAGFERAAAVILALLLLSLLPLPPPLTRLFGPARHAQLAEAASALREAKGFGLLDGDGSVTLFSFTHNRAGTMRIVLLLAAAFSATFLVSRLDRRGRRLLLSFLVALAFVVALAGCVSSRWASQHFTLWWVYPVPVDMPGPMVCFWNRNHYAAFLAMLAPAALSLALWSVRLRKPWFLVPLLVFGVITLGVVFSCSRGGWIAYLAGILTLAVGLLLHRRLAAAIVVLLLLCAAVAFVLRVPGDDIQDRLSTLQDARNTPSYATRVRCWEDSLAIWRHHPLLGVGANGFRSVFPQHRTTTEGSFMTHAENEYVQLLVDGGIAGVLLAACMLACVVRAIAGSGSNAESSPVFATAATAALAAALTSAAVDFPMHIPLYSVTLAAIIGLVFHAGEVGRPGRAQVLPALALAVAVIVALASLGKEKTDDPRWMYEARAGELARAVAWSPTLSYAWHGLGRAAWSEGGQDRIAFGERCMTTAVKYDPLNYRLWRELGYIRMAVEDPGGAAEAFGRMKELRAWVPVPDPYGGTR